MAKRKPGKRARPSFGGTISVEQLTGLAAELQELRAHPPLVHRGKGRYEGDILGFVKGLRLSARIIYFLRECLSPTGLEISWGHILDSADQSCSPECDVIVHQAGHVRKWNGFAHPIMDFRFVKADTVRAVISCKSQLDAIDADYPKALKKFGVDKVFLFAECCRETHLPRLRTKAEKAGYLGLWPLYFAEKGDASYKTDGTLYADFGKEVLKAVR